MTPHYLKVLFSVLILLNCSFTRGAENYDPTQLSWLAGHWQGDGFGGVSEEVWTPAAKGTMMGMFRLHNKKGELVFYEFLTIDKEGLKLKHFNPDMTGWETKENYLTFKFISQTPSSIKFKGLSFELIDDLTMNIHLIMKNGGKINTETFHMKRNN